MYNMLAERAEQLSILDEKDAAIQYWSHALHSRTAFLADPASSLRESSTLLRKWDAEIEGLARQMLTAKQRRNAHALPCSVPAEVLKHIFEHLALMDPMRSTPRKWGWARVTHVCQRFRTVALEHGDLWSDLSVEDDSALWDLLLSRSRNASLSIRGNLDHMVNTPGCYSRQILEQIARVRVLDVTQIPLRVVTFQGVHPWAPILEAKAPELRELKLSMSESGAEDGLTLGSEFLQTASKLVILQLFGIQMPWNIRAPVNLRSLNLDDPGITNYDLTDMLQSLQCLPMLESLHLRYAIPEDDVDESNTLASLPHLHILFLEDIDRRCLELWSALSITSACSVYMEIDRLEPDDDDKLLVLVRAHLALSGSPTYRHMCIGDESRDDHVVRFSAHSTYETVRHTSRKDNKHAYTTDQSPLLSVVFQASGRTEVLLPLLALFPSASVETVIVALHHYSLLSLSQRILHHFPATQYLEAIGTQDNHDGQDFAQDFCWLFANRLSPRFPDGVLKNAVASYMPCLRTLSLSNFMFTHRSVLTGRRLHEDVTRAFERRQAAGLSNPALKIKNSGLKDSWVRAWEEWVTVERDGQSCPLIDENVPSDEDDECYVGEGRGGPSWARLGMFGMDSTSTGE
ncbi:hypothetical protein PENSPDRAFT_732136 [Peniophora sp. CONT]|nr:hypothetical protein PENSPDRAFT_732136 [Peniophora sp. CONT]